MLELPELPPLTIDTWVAIGAVALGLLLCFRGYAAMRWIFALLGGVAGWQLGSWAATYIQFDPDFDNALKWGATIFAAILFACLAYAFFVTGVLLAVGWLGYTLGLVAVTSLGLTDWLAVAAPWLVAVLLVVGALVSKLPKLLLVILTAVIGAAAIIAGTLALIGSVNIMELDAGVLLGNGLLWNLGFVALALAGVFLQLRSGKSNLRAAYS